MATKVEGLQRFRAKVLQRFPQAAHTEIKAANQKNADEFARTVKRSLSGLGDEKAPELESTIEVRDGDAGYGGLGVLVSIGGPEAPYPMHLEGGHRTSSGTHVPAKPFWNPAKRAMAKKAKSRAGRALNKAVKAMAST